MAQQISVNQMLNNAYNNYGSKAFVWSKTRYQFKPKTFKRVIEEVWSFTYSLLNMNLKNKIIMIMADDSYEWMVSYMSIIGYVGVVVPVDPMWTEHDITNICETMQISAIIYSSSKTFLMKCMMRKYSGIKYICLEDKFKEMVNTGREYSAKETGSLRFPQKVSNEICCVYFESATLPKPLGIPMTLENMIAPYEIIAKRLKITHKDICYSNIPMFTIFAQSGIMLLGLYGGFQLCICRDSMEMLDDIQTLRPTIICSNPKFYNSVITSISPEKMRSYRKRIAFFSLANSMGINVKKAVFRNFRNLFGGHQRYMLSGSLPLTPEMKKLYYDLGVRIQEVYGFPEAGGLISIEYPFDKFLGSLGNIVDDIDAKIDSPDENGFGELKIKGDHIFKGYLNDPNFNKKIFDKKGYLLTGDIASIDSKNRIIFHSKKRNCVVTSDGRRIFLDQVKTLLLQSNLIDDAKIFYQNGNVYAILTTKKKGSQVREVIEKTNLRLPRYSRIHAYEIKKMK